MAEQMRRDYEDAMVPSIRSDMNDRTRNRVITVIADEWARCRDEKRKIGQPMAKRDKLAARMHEIELIASRLGYTSQELSNRIHDIDNL